MQTVLCEERKGNSLLSQTHSTEAGRRREVSEPVHGGTAEQDCLTLFELH